MKRAIISAAIVLMLAGAAWADITYTLCLDEYNRVIPCSEIERPCPPCPDEQEKPCHEEIRELKERVTELEKWKESWWMTGVTGFTVFDTPAKIMLYRDN